MILQEFDYCRPGTLDEASQLLKDHNNSMILAGGTDLLVKMRGGSHRPDQVVDIKGIPGLDSISWQDGELFIGANITWTKLKQNETLRNHFPALHQSCLRFGCHEIRNRATVGGNICSASPGCESGGPLLVYEAKAKIFTPHGTRTEPVSRFITGPGRTTLKTGEILTGVLIPMPPENSRSAYRRTARVKGQDLATCAMTIMAVNPDNPELREIRTALSAVEKTPTRPPELEEILSHKPITSEILKKAKDWMRENLHPRASSLRGTPDYKREVLGGILEILLEETGVIQADA